MREAQCSNVDDAEHLLLRLCQTTVGGYGRRHRRINLGLERGRRIMLFCI